MPPFARPTPLGKIDYEASIRGLTPKDIADESHLHSSTISRAMRGGRVQRDTLQRISDVIAKHPVKKNLVVLMGSGPDGEVA